MTTPRALACAAVAGFSLLAVPTAAGADGPPIGFLSPDGVASGHVRHAALPAGRGTLLEKLSLTTAKPLRTHYLGGRVGVPVIASDGTAGGLSHDGGTLVLGAERTTYPQVKSTLYVMNTGNLSLRRRIHLEGDFSFDAISPDGATIYLSSWIRATSRTTPCARSTRRAGAWIPSLWSTGASPTRRCAAIR